MARKSKKLSKTAKRAKGAKKFRWYPKIAKFKRLHKGAIQRCEYRQSATRLQQGTFGLRVLKSGKLNAIQLEAARIQIAKTMKKKRVKLQGKAAKLKSKALKAKLRVLRRKNSVKSKLWLRSIPDIPITAKPLGIRMGKGKGVVNY